MLTDYDRYMEQFKPKRKLETPEELSSAIEAHKNLLKSSEYLPVQYFSETLEGGIFLQKIK